MAGEAMADAVRSIQRAVIFFATVAVVAVFWVMIDALLVPSAYEVRRDAIEAGVAEYYIDSEGDRRFRWTAVTDCVR